MSELDEACDTLEALLGGSARTDLVQALSADRSPPRRFDRLKAHMRRHTLPVDGRDVSMSRWVARLDQRTAAEGFRILQSWDPGAHRFSRDDVPVMLIDYYDYLREGREAGPAVLGILLDFYLLHLLALVAMRAWDDGEPDAVLDRVEHLLRLLQGGHGSGHQFLDSTGMLFILAVSQFHPLEVAYDRWIDRIRPLDARHRLPFARLSGGALGAHLRWGFTQMYRGDEARMRSDNVGDYPWLLFAVATLMQAFADSADDEGARRAIVEDLLNALSADPGAFASEPLPVFEPYRAEFEGFRTSFAANEGALRDAFAALTPGRDAYSPLSFSFNFPHNAVVACTTVALLDEAPCAVPFDALLLGGGSHDGEGRDPRETLARALMRYAGARPERLEARGNRLILYDAVLGARSHEAVMEVLFS